MDKDLMFEAVDIRRVQTAAADAKMGGMDRAVENIMRSIMGGQMPLGEFIRTFVKVAVKSETTKMNITVEQLHSFFDIVGYRDYQIIGTGESRGGKRGQDEDKLTWERLMAMPDEEFRKVTGCERPVIYKIQREDGKIEER